MTRRQLILRDVLDSLTARKPRTALLMLGPAVGVAVLSAVISIAEGTEARIAALVERLGLDMIMVRAGGEVQVFAPTADRGLTVLLESDAHAIEAEIGGVLLVSSVQNQRGITVVNGDRSVTTRAFGVEPDWIDIRRWAVDEGAFVSDSDMAGMTRVVLLGVKVARALFPEGGAVGSTVRIGNDPYTVKGVFIETGVDAGGDDWDDRIVLPFTTSSRRLFNRPYLEQVVLRVDDARRVPAVAEQIRDLLRVRHAIAPGDPDDFFVREPVDTENAAADMSASLSSASVALAVLALLAGGAVITNLMLASVTQRAPEIGLRRATGARTSDIVRQFQLEALLVTLGGGLIGALAGITAALGLEAAGLAASRVTWMTFAASLVACIAIGVVAGAYPARKAARLDPVMALRPRVA
jgi:putative ABC transport system permease protein